jgi:excisionase family DNA binding protein
MTTQPKDVMSRAQAAAYIGIGKSTLDRLNIPKIQIRRRVLFKKEAIDRWLSQHTTKEQA